MYIFFLSFQDSTDAFWLILVKSIVVGAVCAVGVLAILWWILVNGTYRKFDKNFRNKYVLSLIGNIPGFSKLQYNQDDGFLWEEIYHLSIIPLLDVIVDGKFIQALLSPNQPWVGSSNQRVIDVQTTLKQPDLTPVLWKS